MLRLAAILGFGFGFGIGIGLGLGSTRTAAAASSGVEFRLASQGANAYEGEAIRLTIAMPASGTVLPPRADGAEIVGIGESAPAIDRRRQEFAIVPRRPGAMVIPAFRVVIGERSVSSGPYRFNIKPIPIAGRPPTFLGSVGPVEWSVQWDGPPPFRANEWIEGRIRIEGVGALGVHRQPDLSSWERAGAELKWDRIAVEEGVRVLPFRLRAAPPSPSGGALALPGFAISWFDPVSKRFLTRSSSRIRLEIRTPPGFEPEAFRYSGGGAGARTNASFGWLRSRGWRLAMAAAVAVSLILALGALAIPHLRRSRRRRESGPRRLALGLLRELEMVEPANREESASALAQRIVTRLEPILGGLGLSGEEREECASAIWGPTLGRQVRGLMEICDRDRFSARAAIADASALRFEAIRVLKELVRARGGLLRRVLGLRLKRAGAQLDGGNA